MIAEMAITKRKVIMEAAYDREKFSDNGLG
jgi:hypothetical protein